MVVEIIGGERDVAASIVEMEIAGDFARFVESGVEAGKAVATVAIVEVVAIPIASTGVVAFMAEAFHSCAKLGQHSRTSLTAAT
ncbi:hypothetical protein RYX36_007997 [Vicia faba]